MSKENEPAFPASIREKDLTKREYFAALAMQGLATSWNDASYIWTAQKQAAEAVSMADALIAELEKEPQ